MQVLVLGTPLAADGHLRTCIRALAHAHDSCERCDCRNTILFINIVIVVRRMDCITSIMIIITDMAILAIVITIIKLRIITYCIFLIHMITNHVFAVFPQKKCII